MNRCADALTRRGFEVTDRSPDGTLVKVLDYEPRSHPARLQLPGAKAVLLMAALRDFV